MKEKDFFKQKAENYEKETKKVDNVKNIAKLILKEMPYKRNMHLMDFGSGTGLLLSNIAPYVSKITAIDISESMSKVLRSKKDKIPCILEIKKIDLSKETLCEKFDGIISSMTIHHIKNIENIFKKFYDMLDTNGSIAIADLDLEDGSFHTEDTGVFHFGFNRDEFLAIAKKVGFKKLKIQTASTIEKPTGKYLVFLLTGVK